MERKHYICEVPAGRLGKKRIRDIQQKKLSYITLLNVNINLFMIFLSFQPEDARNRTPLRRKTKD